MGCNNHTTRFFATHETITRETVEIRCSCYKVIHKECALAWLVNAALCQVTSCCVAAKAEPGSFLFAAAPMHQWTGIQMNDSAALKPIWMQPNRPHMLEVPSVVTRKRCRPSLQPKWAWLTFYHRSTSNYHSLNLVGFRSFRSTNRHRQN